MQFFRQSGRATHQKGPSRIGFHYLLPLALSIAAIAPAVVLPQVQQKPIATGELQENLKKAPALSTMPLSTSSAIESYARSVSLELEQGERVLFRGVELSVDSLSWNGTALISASLSCRYQGKEISSFAVLQQGKEFLKAEFIYKGRQVGFVAVALNHAKSMIGPKDRNAVERSASKGRISLEVFFTPHMYLDLSDSGAPGSNIMGQPDNGQDLFEVLPK